MKTETLKWILSLCLHVNLFYLAPTLYAFDFSEADSLFEKRAESGDTLSLARKAYLEASKQCEGNDLIYAIEQISRLDVYAALSIDEDKLRSRIPYLEACIREVEQIKPIPGKIPSNPQYFYWSTICGSYLAEARGGLEPLQKASQLFEQAKNGKQINPRYEGGGFDRILGTLNLKLPSFNPWGASGDLGLALKHLKLSLNSEADETAHPELDRGSYHYATHYYYAQAVWDYGNKIEAMQFVKDTIDNILNGDFPDHREPESKLALQWLKALLNKWGQRIQDDSREKP